MFSEKIVAPSLNFYLCVMEKLSAGALNRLSVEAFRAAGKRPFVLVLDNVRSGLNVGSIFRTADAFLAARIVLCGITSQPPHREILKTALGSTETVDWVYFESTEAALESLTSEGYRIWALEQMAEKVWLQDFQVDSDAKYAFVIGNEVEGVDASVLSYCEGAIEIPQFGTKHSLNVAVATGILVWEISQKWPAD